MYKLIYHINRILINLIPSKKLKNVLRDENKRFLFNKTYNFVSVKDAVKDCRHYKIHGGVINVYEVKDFFVSCFKLTTYIHDNHKNILYESGNHHGKDFAPKKVLVKNIEEIDEACNLALGWNSNYWHFTFEAMAKLMAIEESGYKGKYIIFNNSFSKELLKLAEISDDRILFVKDGTDYLVKKLHVIESLNYSANKTTDCLMKFRDKVLSNIDFSDIEKYPERIYVKRIGVRKIKNENDVLKIIDKYGFKTIIPENLSVVEQIKHFYAAKICFSPHGANSTNALYMREGAHFIESFGHAFNNPCVLSAISKIKINYHMLTEYMKAPKIKAYKNYFSENCFSDYDVNMQLLEVILCNIENAEKRVYL